MQPIFPLVDRWTHPVVAMLAALLPHRLQVRVLVSSASSGPNFDLRCRVRDGLIDFVQREYPAALPRLRSSDDSDARQASIVDGQPA